MHSRVKALLITAAILCACLLGCAAYAYGLQAEGWHCGSAEEGITAVFPISVSTASAKEQPLTFTR